MKPKKTHVEIELEIGRAAVFAINAVRIWRERRGMSQYKRDIQSANALFALQEPVGQLGDKAAALVKSIGSRGWEICFELGDSVSDEAYERNAKTIK